MSGDRDKPGEDPDAKAERLARALRENLRRRKAQARARAAESRDEAAGDAVDRNKS